MSRCRRRVHDRADHDLARGGVLLQSGGQVEDVAGGHRRPAERIPDDHLAGFDPDPQLEDDAMPLSGVGRQRGQAVADRERSPDRPFRVVLVRLLQAEEGHHRVAAELLGAPTEAADLLDRAFEELGHDGADDFGIEAVRQGGGCHQVGKQGRDMASLLGAHAGHQGMSAVRAEPGIV